MNRINELWPPHAFRFKTAIQWINPLNPISLYNDFKGKSSSTPAPATPTPTAPATAASPEVIQAQEDLRRQALRKRGYAGAVFAPDTGGWFPGNLTPSPSNQNTSPTQKLGS